MTSEIMDAPAKMATLLVELLTEELPPKALPRLAQVFCDALAEDLRKDGLTSETSRAEPYATPRRLAVVITDVLGLSPERTLEAQGPSVKAALDSDGKPTPALAGFAKKNGVAIEALIQVDTPKGKVFACRKQVAGLRLDASLPAKVEAALKRMPVPKMMRWGTSDAEFVRPAHGIILMHGRRVIPGRVLGIASRGATLGHRFLSAGDIAIPSADEYADVLEVHGKVIASFEKRRQKIRDALAIAAAGSEPLWDDALLDEVTALVESPAVYAGAFSSEYLEVPPECLTLSMKQHQRYFPLAGSDGKLVSHFLIVSNIETGEPGNIVNGNERVLRARLADARFFYDQDRRTRLEERVPRLARVVYHNKLGSQLDRTERIQLLAGKIARLLDADASLAERAAWLAKADLLTGMVGEFPELQGVMGRYYAMHDGEPQAVANAIAAHYRPRFAGDRLPEDMIACSVALAEKFEALAGMFGIGQQPTGEKDPYALRRHALGAVRILVEQRLPLELDALTAAAHSVFPAGMIADANADIDNFIYERLRGYLRDAGYSANEIESVLCMRPARLDQVPLQLAAVRAFAGLPEAESLASANKRVANILRQAQDKGLTYSKAESAALVEAAERELFAALRAASDRARPLFEQGNYTDYLKTFAVLKAPVDAFFDAVMVMVDEPRLRGNRLALLADLRAEMNRVADIAKLAA
jgi:glycyl-tRNA synthetase beta chain